MDEQAIFLAALERDDADERAAYVQQACGDDDDLRRRVRELLRSHEESEGFLERPYLESVPTEPAAAEAGDRPSTACEEPTRVEETADDSVSLHFLAPSDEPDHLGRLGPYEISEVIGRGGMGVVLKGHDARLNRVVAIKVLSLALASDAMARKRFLREARAAAAVSHPHVITIHAVEGSADPPYLVMECVDGSSLQQKLDRDGALPLVEIVRVGAQVASGLAAAHEQGLIHRDVKPSNILLENGVERVKITDFGLARAVDDVGMTRSGEVTGTPQYMSPEQAQSRDVDQRSDLFSLGCVLYAMCTGRSPFRADSTPAALRRVCDDRPRPIHEVNTDIPRWLVKLVDRLLAKDPRKRLQSARSVADELQRRVAELQFPTLVQSASASKRRCGLFRRRPRIVVGLSMAFLVLLGLGVAEATDVTQVREFVATLLRIRTPEGTLVVQVDDPDVRVQIEGDSEVLITGAGPQQVRLEPGRYRLEASRDGQPVHQELVTITRGGREVVDVTLDSEPPKPAATAQPERDGARADTPTVSSVERIWHNAPHNGYTDLTRFKDHWYCVFREGASPNSKNGAVRVISSRNGNEWRSEAQLSFEAGDLRDPKITPTPDGKLMLSAVAALHPSAGYQHQSLVWFSHDGRQWSDVIQIGEPDFWIWRITWHRGIAYGVGYSTAERNTAHLYRSEDGRSFEVLVKNLFDQGYPSESSLVFLEDNTCICLLREDEQLSGVQLGTARPPYTNWSWRPLGVRVGGPNMIRIPDGRLLLAGRDSFLAAAKTRLWQVDIQNSLLTPLLTLPSGRDTGYPGVKWHDGMLWMTYHSAHEGKASVYLARIKIPLTGRVESGGRSLRPGAAGPRSARQQRPE